MQKLDGSRAGCREQVMNEKQDRDLARVGGHQSVIFAGAAFEHAEMHQVGLESLACSPCRFAPVIPSKKAIEYGRWQPHADLHGEKTFGNARSHHGFACQVEIPQNIGEDLIILVSQPRPSGDPVKAIGKEAA